MSRCKAYQRLLNDKRWKTLRIQYLQTHPLCERCKAEGIITAAVDVHHRKPVEEARTPQDMEARCFDWLNLQALCVRCHILTHQEQRSHTRDAHQQRAREDLARWLEGLKGQDEPLTKTSGAPF